MKSSIKEPLVSQYEERASTPEVAPIVKKKAARRQELYAERLGFEVLDKDILESEKEEKVAKKEVKFEADTKEGVHSVMPGRVKRDVKDSDPKEAEEAEDDPFIDFKTMHKEYKERTEFTLPFTITRM